MSIIKAILVDDEQSARNVLNNLLERTSSIEVVATCCDLEEGVKKIKELRPQVVFLDVQMPNYAGYEIVKFFKNFTKILIYLRNSSYLQT